MTKKGIITTIISLAIAIGTPVGLYVFIIPLIIGFIGGKKIRKFYFHYFFKEECK